MTWSAFLRATSLELYTVCFLPKQKSHSKENSSAVLFALERTICALCYRHHKDPPSGHTCSSVRGFTPFHPTQYLDHIPHAQVYQNYSCSLLSNSAITYSSEEAANLRGQTIENLLPSPNFANPKSFSVPVNSQASLMNFSSTNSEQFRSCTYDFFSLFTGILCSKMPQMSQTPQTTLSAHNTAVDKAGAVTKSRQSRAVTTIERIQISAEEDHPSASYYRSQESMAIQCQILKSQLKTKQTQRTPPPSPALFCQTYAMRRNQSTRSVRKTTKTLGQALPEVMDKSTYHRLQTTTKPSSIHVDR